MTPPDQTSKNVMAAISDGQVKMHSRWFFRWRHVLWLALLVVIVLAVAWYNSFVLFALDHSDRFFLLTLGSRGLGVFLRSVPWLVFLFGVVLLALLTWFMYRVTKFYRWPVGLGFLMIILGAGAVGYAVSFTPLQKSIHRPAIERHMPLLGGLYEALAEREPTGTISGVVTKITADGFIIMDRDLDLDAVLMPAGTKIDRPIQPNDVVLVIGEEQNEIIRATAIRHLSERFRAEVLINAANTVIGD